jgi:RNA polymerase sigma-70 factor (sigma-E family)
MSGSDEAEFRVYVASRQAALRRTAFFMCGDWHDADDLVQATLTKLFIAWRRVTSKDGPDAYAYRILANSVIDARRRPWRREVSTESLADGPDTSTSAAATDQRLDLAQALAALPPRQRVTVILRFWVDASVAETAEVLGCSTGTVKSQTARGLESLRRLLRSDDPLVATYQEMS